MNLLFSCKGQSLAAILKLTRTSTGSHYYTDIGTWGEEMKQGRTYIMNDSLVSLGRIEESKARTGIY